MPPAEQLDLADGEGADSDGVSYDESETDSATEDEFAQLPESQAERNGRAEDEDEEEATPWDADARAEAPDEGVTVRRTEERHRNNHGRTNGNRENRGPNREEQRSGPAAGTAADSQRQVDPGAHQRAVNQDGQMSEEQNSHPGVENETKDGRTKTAKRKFTTANRNCRRDRKRLREISIGRHNQNQQDLQLIIGEGLLSPQVNRSSAVPWEHRGILGHTREGRGQERETMDT